MRKELLLKNKDARVYDTVKALDPEEWEAVRA